MTGYWIRQRNGGDEMIINIPFEVEQTVFEPCIYTNGDELDYYCVEQHEIVEINIRIGATTLQNMSHCLKNPTDLYSIQYIVKDAGEYLTGLPPLKIDSGCRKQEKNLFATHEDAAMELNKRLDEWSKTHPVSV